MTTLPVRDPGHVDLIAAAWGGLVASVGLMVAGDRDLAIRLLVTAITFFVGGFLAGVRAGSRRRLHGVVAALLGVAIFAAFVALANVIATRTGPDPPEFAPGGAIETAGVVLWSVAFAFLGASLAHRWLRPSRRRASSA